MSDSITKWFEQEEERKSKPYFNKVASKIVSEGHKKQAYQILVEYSEEAILEAARILECSR